MARIEYEKRKAYAHTLTPESIEGLLLSLENRTYRAVLELCFLTMSRISEICTMRVKDILRWHYRGRRCFLLLVGVSKRQGAAKIVPVLRERQFSRIYQDVRDYLAEHLADEPGTWLFGEPGIHKYIRGPTARCRKARLTETDNLLRKRISKYAKQHIGFNPHMFRHARYAICQYLYRMTDSERQSLGMWKDYESMLKYGRYANPYEIAAALTRKR